MDIKNSYYSVEDISLKLLLILDLQCLPCHVRAVWCAAASFDHTVQNGGTGMEAPAL